MAVGGGRQVVEVHGGALTTRTKMTVTLSGGWVGGWVGGRGWAAVWRGEGGGAGPHTCLSPPPPRAADNRVYDGEVAGRFLEAFTRHMNAPFALM